MYNMATELDLDINNYNINDIEKFFRFKPKSKYSPSDVELRECEIREQLLTSGHINKKLKGDLIAFLILAKQWLIDTKCEIIAPTSIPKNFRLDQDNYPRSKELPAREDNLIEKPAVPFVYTKNSDFFPSMMNPIEKRIVTKLICIDTLFRQNYYNTKSTDFIYTLPDSINNVVEMKLIALEIPNIWFNISNENHNNQFTVDISNVCITDQSGNLLDNMGNITFFANTFFTNYKFTIAIPDGNYSDATFQECINNIFHNTLIDDLNQPTIALRFLNITIGGYSTKNTIIRANSANPLPCPYDSTSVYYSPDFSFTVNFNTLSDQLRPLYKNLGWIMGFRKINYEVSRNNTYISYSDSSQNVVNYKGYLKSEAAFTASTNNYIFIEVDDYHNNFTTDAIISMNKSNGTAYMGQNIMARITITSGPNTIVNDNAADKIFKKREYFGPVRLEKMKFRILNRFGDVLNLNKMDYSMVFEIKQLYTV